MSEANEQLLTAARDYVTDLYQHRIKPELVFHTLEHTEDVVEACSYMADHFELEETDRLVLMLAAWFHDTGYVKGEAAGHEAESIRIATAFLTERAADPVVIQRVSSCIEATRMPQSPVSLIEKILCDADLFHLATPDFTARNQLLRKEQETLMGQKIPPKTWRRNNIKFLEEHHYLTEYGQQQLEPKKNANLQQLKRKRQKGGKKEVPPPAPAALFPYSSATLQTPEEAKIEQKNTERGIQTMFRTTSNNHFELSTLADGKANIMISVNAIIISVVLTVLLVRIPYYKQYIIPTALLAITCLAAMIFAILATRPSISSGRFSEEDIRSKRTNLLFFGNFYRMTMEEYQWGMNEMLKDREYLYNSMIKDIYYLGVVLARKYRFLRIAYTIFMYGLIISVVAFAIAALYGATNPEVGSNAPLIDY
jgi:predicted metal-dependent HD superfamily phosphohydrolase